MRETPKVFGREAKRNSGKGGKDGVTTPPPLKTRWGGGGAKREEYGAGTPESFSRASVLAGTCRKSHYKHREGNFPGGSKESIA